MIIVYYLLPAQYFYLFLGGVHPTYTKSPLKNKCVCAYISHSKIKLDLVTVICDAFACKYVRMYVAMYVVHSIWKVPKIKMANQKVSLFIHGL